MRKSNIVLIVLLLALLSACSSRTTVSIPMLPPQIYVTLNTDGLPIQHISIGRLSHFWDPGITDGQGRDIRASSASARHSLAVWDWGYDVDEEEEKYYRNAITVYLDGVGGEIELSFSDNLPPYVVNIRRWRTEFIGRDLAGRDQYELIELEGNIFHVSDDGIDYIYEIHARWEQGYSFYTFRMNSGK